MWISFRCKSGGLVDHFWVQFNSSKCGGNFLITDGASFQRIEHSQADADAWAALGYTVTKLR